MNPYVMFGVHPLFGEYVDAIHAAGGRLATVVLNVHEPERPQGQRFEDGLDRYHRWLERAGIDHRVDVQWLDEFTPNRTEIPVLGFRGTNVHLPIDHGGIHTDNFAGQAPHQLDGQVGFTRRRGSHQKDDWFTRCGSDRLATHRPRRKNRSSSFILS